MKLSLDDLYKIKGAKILNPKAGNFSGVSIDSRKTKKGNLFFAIKGERFDGHDFVMQIKSKNVSGMVVNNSWYRSITKTHMKRLSNTTLCLVKDSTKALGELAAIYRKKFLIPVIGIAGSNGKTTTKDTLAHLLSKKYKVLKTEGNFNNHIGVPLTLFRLNKNYDMAVIELGTNKFGEVKNLCEIAKPQFGIITNIGKEHLEFLKDVNGAARAECELLDYIRKTFGTFFLNNDDVVLRKKIRNLDKVFSYGARGDVKGRIKRFIKFYPAVELNFKRENISVSLQSAGIQSFHSTLSSAAIGYYFGLSASQIKSSLATYKNESSKRNQLIRSNGLYIIDDTYNSNPDSVKSALESMAKYNVKSEKHVVLADMLELGSASEREHYRIGVLARKMGIKNLYTFGKDSYQTFKGAFGIKNNFYFTDKNLLSEYLKSILNKDDVVLVKGSRGMKMEEIVGSLVRKN